MRIRLAVRYTLISSIVLLVVMSAWAFMHINKVQKAFIERAKIETDVISDMILRDTYHLMLENDRDRLQLTMEETGKSARVERIRILGKEGVINFSSNVQEIGTTLDESDDSCAFCHISGSKVLIDAPIDSRSRVFSDEEGNQYLSVTRGIYNEPNCYTGDCHFHSPDEMKVGVLDLAVSLDQMAALAHSHHMDVIIQTIVMLVFLSLCHYLWTRKYICDPIQGLLEQTKALSRGDLTARVKSPSRDEIGELGQSFNKMADNLALAQLELKEWGDILEHKVEERTSEIHEMQDQLVRSAKLASMGELVAGIAHEINNPLTGILMFASLSSKNPDLPPQVKDNLDLIVSETGRCAKIVRGLLEFARESIPEKKPESVNRIIEQSLELIVQQTMFQDIDIRSNLNQALPDIAVDSDQLQQVFFNMFINAGQAMPEGGELVITTGLASGEDAIRIDIEDSGIGISQQDLERIFDPFFSTKAQKGFGLGLSVSYGIIRNHGGRVDVESEEGRGTHFIIYIPVSEDVMLDASEERKSAGY